MRIVLKDCVPKGSGMINVVVKENHMFVKGWFTLIHAGKKWMINVILLIL